MKYYKHYLNAALAAFPGQYVISAEKIGTFAPGVILNPAGNLPIYLLCGLLLTLMCGMLLRAPDMRRDVGLRR